MRGLTLHMIAALAPADLRKVLEEDFQKAVCAFADSCGYQVHYQRKSGFKGTDGKWRGSGPKGFPDLVLARADRNPIFCELKKEGQYLDPHQKEWRDALGEAYWRWWRPRDSEAIIEELSRTHHVR